jgi:phosphate starvation-inducible protein PhoH and related proteins
MFRYMSRKERRSSGRGKKQRPDNFQKPQQPQFKSKLKPKTENQAELIRTIAENTVVLALGPAGTGKTKVSVAYGIEKLLVGEFKRLVVTRPVVEAGERLGYLPGSFSDKIDPYLQPIYYELLQYLSKAQLQEFINNGANCRGFQEIIIAPLAYMRGMNYHDAYMVLDEAQNCTPEQIKLFITRVGFNSKAVLVGDDKQSDLPGGRSGLGYWHEKLQDVEGVGTFKLDRTDIIRNPVISKILSKIGE